MLNNLLNENLFSAASTSSEAMSFTWKKDAGVLGLPLCLQVYRTVVDISSCPEEGVNLILCINILL
jgi:hypothetical protein